MSEPVASDRLVALPAEIVAVEGGAVLRRGLTQVRIQGDHVEHVLRLLLLLGEGEGYGRAAMVETVRAHFAALPEDAIQRLLDVLVERRVFVPADGPPPGEPAPAEGPLDVFLWNFLSDTESVRRDLGSRYVPVLGVNDITRRLAVALAEAGFGNVEIVDSPDLRNPSLFGPSGELLPERWPGALPRPVPEEEWRERLEPGEIACMVAACDMGDQGVLRPLNRFAVEAGIPFLPIVLADHVGWIGPLVIGGETPCLECLRARQNANMGEHRLRRAVEEGAGRGPAGTGYHPSMASILADIAVIQLSKGLVAALPNRQGGQIVEVDLLAPSIQTRKLLKVPRCHVCGGPSRISAANPDKREFMHEEVG